jgi:hypothetical protein
VPWWRLYSDIGMRQAGGIRRVSSDGDREPCQRLRRQGRATGEQHANGLRVSRHRLVADVTVGVIANAMSGR